MMAIPNPFNTLGIELTPAYVRKPGEEMRSKERIADNFVTGWYFNAILIVLCFFFVLFELVV